ncbi:hypothetical protein D9619_010287 [Psilocybe cf. subviscida]|uniref:F-box domain-containing protein n=1 Tax=Psilocybe cf. subviscida TaxID=2480587 RepID=A0A8H5ASD1_9AGAR|nr:hypothetical protein D9619_010287 [Psilocybe cf. subviscida]
MTTINREQSAYVSSIPLEIFSEILSYLGPAPKHDASISDLIADAESPITYTIRSLSLVCRHFYHLLFPMRLQTIFVVNDRGDQSKYKLLHCRRFCRAIVDGNVRARALAAYVERFAIGRFDLTVAGRMLVEEELAVYSEVLPFMSNLRTLHLFQTSITNGLLNAILSLPPLKVLRLGDCNVPYDLDRKLLRQFSAIRVTHVSTWGPFFGNNEHATNQFLSALCMSYTKTLTCKPSTSFRLLKGLASLGPMEHLSDIHIGLLHLDEHTNLLSDVLFATPALKRLHVAEISHWNPHDEAFKPYTKFPRLPHLEYIYAHMPALEALIPGNRVSTVGIASERLGMIPSIVPLSYPRGLEFWQTLAAVIKKSRQPIENLDVPMLFYTNICFATHFPGLRRLTLHLQHLNWVYDSSLNYLVNLCDKVAIMLIDSWPEHPDLIELELVFDSGLTGLNLEPWTLVDLKDALPSLSSLILTRPCRNERKEIKWPEGDQEASASEATSSSES